MILQPDTIQTGMIVLYAGNTVPEGWLLCHGQTIRRDHYPNLCAILPEGTESGTHVLPDLRGRLVVGQETGTGLSQRTTGEKGGNEHHRLLSEELSEHGHILQAQSAAATVATPVGMVSAASPINRGNGLPIDTPYHHSTNATAHADAVLEAGENEEHPNMMPFLVLNAIIKV